MTFRAAVATFSLGEELSSIRVTVDPDNLNGERDESNNMASISGGPYVCQTASPPPVRMRRVAQDKGCPSDPASQERNPRSNQD